MKRFYIILTLIFLYNLTDAQTVNFNYDRGVSSMYKKQYDDAIRDFTIVVNKDPYYWEAYHDMGLCHIALGKKDKAIEDFTNAINAKKDYLSAYMQRAQLYYELGQKKEAITDYNQILTLKPDHVKAYEKKGELYYKSGDTKNALADLSKAIDLKTDNPDMYMYRADIYYNDKKLNEAISDYTWVLKNTKESLEACTRRGLSYYQLEDYENAAKDLNKSIALKTTDNDVYLKCAEACFKTENYKDAITAYTSYFTKTNPRDADLYYKRGVCYSRTEQYPLAAKDFSKAIIYDRDHYASYYERAYAYTFMGKAKEPYVKNDFNKAIELKSDCHEAYFYRGKQSFNKQNYDAAIADFTKAIKISREPRYFFYRGACYNAMSQFTEACADLKTAANGGFPEAIKALPQICP